MAPSSGLDVLTYRYSKGTVILLKSKVIHINVPGMTKFPENLQNSIQNDQGS